MGKLLLTFLILLTTITSLGAQAQWEVAVFILGGRQTEESFQKDIDENILELAQTRPGKNFRLSIYREYRERAVQFFPDPSSSQLHAWDPLFHQVGAKGIQVAGELKEMEKGPDTLLLQEEKVRGFFKKAFRDPKAHRLLFLYGHGIAFAGLSDIYLYDLKEKLTALLPAREARKPLDVLWFNACFMANVEAAYELRHLTNYYVASEEAEFSKGSPFKSLRLLTDGTERSVARTIRELAEAYLESYSYLEEGEQSSAVHASAATLSVLETKYLGPLVASVAKLVKGLKPFSDEQIATLRRSRKLIDLKMEEKQFVVDFGNLLYWFKDRKQTFPAKAVQDEIKALLALLELNRAVKENRNPRVWMVPPVENSWAVYGYQNWNKGHEQDAQNIDRLKQTRLKPEQFVDGPRSKRWPSRSIAKELWVSPFLPSLDHFLYYFVSADDPEKPITKTFTAKRDKDIAFFEAEEVSNPLVFAGYTQSVGAAAERYTGFTVLDPLQDQPPPEYLLLDFAKDTGWAQLAPQ